MKITPVSEIQLVELFALYDEYDRPQDKHPDLTSAANILAEIREQGAEVFVIGESSIEGTYTIHICNNLTRSGRPYAVVENVICSESTRRQGLGRALMNHAIEHAKQKGCYKILLQTGEKRVENHAFYEACGFQGGKRAFQIRFSVDA